MKLRYAYARLYVDSWINVKRADRKLVVNIYGAFTTIEYAKGYSAAREGDIFGGIFIDIIVDLEEEKVLYGNNFASKWVGLEKAVIYRHRSAEEIEELLEYAEEYDDWNVDTDEEVEEHLADWWVNDEAVLEAVKSVLEAEE